MGQIAHPINYSISISYLRTRRLIYFVIVAAHGFICF